MALSPMMKQYLELKKDYKDCIVLYRLGDFYEMFYEDAIEGSKALGLTLTGRDCGMTERAPMCGVPYHALNTYLTELVKQGYKVAICEQLTEPSKNEIVTRGVVRVVTSGTKIDPDMIDEKENNYIACISQIGGMYAVAWADISTGEMKVANCGKGENLTELIELLLKIAPSEIISNSEIANIKIKEIERDVLPKISKYHDWAFLTDNATKRIKKQFGVLSLEPYGIEKNNSAISACGALFEYFEDTQKRKLDHFERIQLVKSENYMRIDSNTRRNLELLYSNRDGKRFGTLYGLLNKTKTPMGARLLAKWIEEPLINETRINNRLFAVKDLIENYFNKDQIAENLSKIRDIERLVSKISYRSATPVDFLAIKNSLEIIPNLKIILNEFNSPLIKLINESIENFLELYEFLNSAISDEATAQIKDGGYIKAGFNAELDRLKGIMSSSKTLVNQMEESEREKTGIRGLKIGYNRVFGYYIEITKSYQQSVPINYVRKQTIANAERYITEELKQLENEILNSTDNSIKLENELFKQVLDYSTQFLKPLLKTAGSIATLDVLVAFAVVAEKNNYIMPIISEDNKAIEIEDGRHPVIEKILTVDQFVPNDTYINSEDSRTMILTGPNMAGKSTYMRQVALISIMAQMGSFVPCKQCKLPIFDKLFTRVGASDNLIFDQSTFMVEMIEVSNILHNATKDSLIILDEVGRGTSTLDGLSIAFAVTKYITSSLKAKTLFATHYHELTELEGTVEGVANYRISVREQNGGIIFLRKIVRGGANRSFGIEVASLAGLPKTVIKEAKKILKELEDSDIINTKKQLSFDDVQNAVIETEDYEDVIDKIKGINLDEVSPKQAHMILEELKEMIK